MPVQSSPLSPSSARADSSGHFDALCVGGGPGGLYFSILLKKTFPSARVRVVERNRPDDTFGFGVVFSKETLSNIEEADPETYAAISDRFVYWDDIDTVFRDRKVTSGGHGFCGLARKELLLILQRRAAALGVDLAFSTEFLGLDEATRSAHDLIVACDGVNSGLRQQFADRFRPTIAQGRCRFTWLGTTLPLEAFTFFYREHAGGTFAAHSYPFQRTASGTLSTFIVECHEDTWKRAGLEHATEADTVALCARIFAKDLEGHPLLVNRSLWRAFPTVRNERWHFDNVVLIGDAAHTAHFSIGSGTKLAMEDAIALVDAFRARGTANVPEALAHYQEHRELDVAKLQRAADTSRAWFEHVKRYADQDPVQFAFNQTTRSKRITWDNLRLRDPAFVDRVRDGFARAAGAGADSAGNAPVPMFTPYALRGLALVNRVVVSPMCMYSAVDGTVNDWHLVHLGSRAVGGAGLVMTEMTDVSPDARITPACAGMYADAHVAAWRRIVDFVHGNTRARIGIQLAHAGRKGATKIPWEAADEPLESGGWPLLAPSALPWTSRHAVPKAMDRSDMERVRDDFVRATLRAEEAGFDLIEVHMAHGYLLSSFISPLSNRRTDAYGGPIGNRMRFPLEVFEAMRAVWPREKPMSVRVSATDWVEDGGLTQEDAVQVAVLLKERGCDVVDVSAGSTWPDARPVYGRMFQVPFSDRIRHEAGIPTMTVGNIQNADQVNTILAAGRADLCVLARAHLADPYLTLHAAETYDFDDQFWPNPYLAAKPRRRKG